MACVFCGIAKRELPAEIVYENDNLVAFLDIKPTALGHLLIVPKQHFENMEAVDEATLATMIVAAKKLGQSIMNDAEVKGYKLIINNGVAAGQIVNHLHLHVIPCREARNM